MDGVETKKKTINRMKGGLLYDLSGDYSSGT